MTHRTSGQMSFVDGLASKRLGRNETLEAIGSIVDWGRFERLLKPVRPGTKGAPPYPPLLMFKVLLLQQWYALSDPEAEEALMDRLSFRRFVGLGLEDNAPDHSTISRFRSALVAAGLDRRLFGELQVQLGSRGLLVKAGTLIDASLVSSAAAKPSVAQGDQSPVDPEAKWGKVGHKAVFGYKMHVAVDQGSQLIRDFALTTANVAEGSLAPTLVAGDEAAVYADKAYDNATLRGHLAARGIANGVMARANRHYPLSPEAEARNRALRTIRAAVERVFGTMKCYYRFARMRYLGLARNTLALMLTCFAMNLRRAVRLAT